MSGEKRFAVRGSPLSRQVGDEVFVLTAKSEMHWMKNDSASFIWGALVDAGPQGLTVDALVLRLTADFEIGPEAASRDVLDFIADLERVGLVASLV